MLAKVSTRFRRPALIAVAVIAAYAVIGFFLAPWLVKKYAVEAARESIGAPLRIERVSINPFVLSVQIDGIELDDPANAAFLRVQGVFANFQLSSLFRLAWTFDEVRFDAPEVFLARASDGNLNLGFLMSQTGDKQVTDSGESSAETSSPRVLIFDFAINESVINWHDEFPVDDVRTKLGPINIAIQQLNTLPDRAGRQEVVITTETSGTLAWSGSLQLNPLMSAGHASVKGSHFPLASAYLKHEAGFDIVEGTSDVELDYQVTTAIDGSIEASVSDLNLSFDDIQVRTFNDAFGIDEVDRDVLRLSKLALSGGSMRWPARTLGARSLSIDNTVVSLYRDPSGRLNISPVEGQAEPGADIDPDPAPATDWQIDLDEFLITEMALELEDDSVSPTARIGVRSFDLEMRDLSNRDSAVFPTSLTLLARTEGRLSMDGSVSVLPVPKFDFEIRVQDLAVAGAHPYLKPLADVNLDSGALNFVGNIAGSEAEPLLLTGDLQIADFLITETDEGSRLGSWNELNASNLNFSVANQSLDISEIRLDQPYGDILIAEDGSINLGRVQKGIQKNSSSEASNGGGDVDEDGTTADTEPSAEQSDATVTTTIGRVVVEKASANFADRSLPLPFEARISDLNGELSTIATDSAEPSKISLEGRVDDYGLVRVSGFATPIDPALNTDIDVVFENVQMPKFSAYMIPFAGREIASGSLDIGLGYKVSGSELEGENNVVLRDFELGEKVDHPGAMSLPLGLAVALLKDSEGKINIDLPIRGNLDDPEFKYGGVVLTALGNLITGIVTSPFKLLANLVGAESEDLEYIGFAAGRADLTPPESERASKIANALMLRPELMLEIGGVIEPEADADALKAAFFDAVVDERIDAATATESSDAMYTVQRLEVIEALYRESGVVADVPTALAELRARYTSATSQDESGEIEHFDELAYTEDLRRQLIEVQSLAEEALPELAAARANGARVAIISVEPDLEPRIQIVETSILSRDDDGVIRMQMSLTAGTGGD